VSNTPIFLRTSASGGQLDGSLVLNNIKLINVPTAIGLFSGDVLLAGGTTTITSWAQGNIFTGSDGTGTFTQDDIAAPNKPAALLDSAGNIFGRTHPQYADYAVDQFVSVRDQGAMGDGVTDDTEALKEIFAAVCSILNGFSLYSLNFFHSSPGAKLFSSMQAHTSSHLLSPFLRGPKWLERRGR
jgi:hypothetical protein